MTVHVSMRIFNTLYGHEALLTVFGQKNEARVSSFELNTRLAKDLAMAPSVFKNGIDRASLETVVVVVTHTVVGKRITVFKLKTEIPANANLSQIVKKTTELEYLINLNDELPVHLKPGGQPL